MGDRELKTNSTQFPDCFHLQSNPVFVSLPSGHTKSQESQNGFQSSLVGISRETKGTICSTIFLSRLSPTVMKVVGNKTWDATFRGPLFWETPSLTFKGLNGNPTTKPTKMLTG